MTTIKHHRYKQNKMNPLQPFRLTNRPEVWKSEKPCINKRKSIKMLSSQAGPHETFSRQSQQKRRIFGVFFKYDGSPPHVLYEATHLNSDTCLTSFWEEAKLWHWMSVSMWTQSCGFVFCVSNYEQWSEWQGGNVISRYIVRVKTPFCRVLMILHAFCHWISEARVWTTCDRASPSPQCVV